MRKVPTERLPIPPELENTAIGCCCRAWSRALEKATAEGWGQISCRLRANEAYRIAMPPLTSPENIRDFVACVTHGQLLSTIIDTVAAQLIHAAQVASRLSKAPTEPSKATQTESSTPETAASEQS
jgi:hypothetical protein